MRSGFGSSCGGAPPRVGVAEFRSADPAVRRGPSWRRPPVRTLTSLPLVLFPLLVHAPSSRAQDPLSAPSAAIVPFVELNFRGERGKIADGTFDFSNGVAFGVGLSGWLSGTFGLGVRGSYARTEHCQSFPIVGAACPGSDVTLWRGLGELSFRVKPRVPGYFLIGGGVTVVSPEDEEPSLFSDGAKHTEPTLTAGAGLDLRVSRRGFAKVELRLYIQVPEDQAGVELNSTQRDLAVNFGFAYRL